MFSFFWKNKKNQAKNLDLASDLRIKEQLESQIKMLEKLGILEALDGPEPKTLGITGIDNQKYPVPTFQEISKGIEEKKDLIKIKSSQGFTKMLLVPLGYPLNKLIQKYEEAIRSHYANNRLFYFTEKAGETKLNLNKENPLNVWNEYEEADVNNYIIYFPRHFKKENHGGGTKKVLLLNPKNAWLILLVKDMPNIPRAKNGKTMGGRHELESGKTPLDYLRIIQTEPAYEGEMGLPPEASIIYVLTHLEETNHIVNDWLANGCIEYSLGAFFATTENIPWSSWNSDFHRADLWKANSWNKDEYMGTRTGVKI